MGFILLFLILFLDKLILDLEYTLSDILQLKEAVKSVIKVYGIKEVSQRTGLSEYTLRYYEKINLLKIIKNSISNKREYTEKNLEQIEYIKALKLIGFKLQEIEKYYNLKLGDMDTLLERKEILKFQRKKVSEQMETLLKVNKLIGDKIDCIDIILRERR